jgi:glycosyltransferase involved in cell wall biosynthesis
LFVQSSDYEGTPNAVLEAMAMKTPIVATDAGGTAELVTDQSEALLVPRDNALQLASAIETAMRHPIQTARRVSEARRRVENELSFDRRMATLEEIYRELIEHRNWPDNDAARTVLNPLPRVLG